MEYVNHQYHKNVCTISLKRYYKIKALKKELECAEKTIKELVDAIPSEKHIKIYSKYLKGE